MILFLPFEMTGFLMTPFKPLKTVPTRDDYCPGKYHSLREV